MYIILPIISGIVTAFAFPTVFGQVRFPNLGFLAWISLVPLFYVLRSAAPRRAFAYSFLSFAVCYGISLYWLYTALNTYGRLDGLTSVGVLVLLIVVLSAYISLAPALSAWVEKKTGVGRFWTLPVFWVVCEIARNYGPCGGFPWGNITNTQYAYLPVIQIVDIAGVYGLTYVMVVVNAAIAEYCSGRACSAKIMQSKLCRYTPCNVAAELALPKLGKASFAATLIIFTLVYGFFRLHYIDKEQAVWPSIRAAMLQGDIPQDEKWHTGLEEKQLAPYQKYTQMLKAGSVSLIVWPEASYPWPLPLSKDNLPPEALGLDGFASGSKTFLLVGGLTIDDARLTKHGERRLYNSMLLVNSGGDIVERYHKVHLVPFGEYVPYKKLLFFAKKLVAPVGNFVAGEKLEPLFTDDYRIAGLICYEDLFPEIARRLVGKGANVIAVITNDAWYGRSSAAFQHLAISVFRAVENRRWMVKAANSGVSAVVDAAGRVISKTGIFEQGMIVSNVRLGTGNSLYTKYGDWFGFGCCLTAGVLIIFGVVRRKIASGD